MSEFQKETSRLGSAAIIHHKLTTKTHADNALLAFVAKRWSERSIEVKNVFGTSRLEPADVAFLHVDLSVVPQAYTRFVKRYPVAFNAGITDIRKRTYSRLEVENPAMCEGPVIVKSNFNASGKPERRIARARPAPFRLAARLSMALGFGGNIGARKLADPYAVYASAKDVPEEFFADDDFIVERFVPERDGDYYCHRRYYFLGSVEVFQLWLGRQKICRGDTDGDEGIETEPSSELQAFRKSMAMDFGKIDYVHDDSGKPVILDVNTTPGCFCKCVEDEIWRDELCDRLQWGLPAIAQSAREPHGAEDAPR